MPMRIKWAGVFLFAVIILIEGCSTSTYSLQKDFLSGLPGLTDDTTARFSKVVYIAPRRRDYIVPFNVLARPDSRCTLL